MLNFDKYDRYGEVIRPGDVCARAGRGGAELVVYKGHSWGAKGSKGEFGRFITPDGNRSIKYSSIVFAFDPVGNRRSKAKQATKIIREFYEGR